MGGRETNAKLLEMDAKCTTIVSSGYSEDRVMCNYRDHGFSDVLPKPYRLEEISAVLGRVKDGKMSLPPESERSWGPRRRTSD